MIAARAALACLLGLAVSLPVQAADELMVFVGEKISLEQFHPVVKENEIMMDSAFHAKYRVLQRVFGPDPGAWIDFTVFDHYGEPKFSKFATVLLFVSRTPNGNFHNKYQFYPVYRTNIGLWAGCSNTWLWTSERTFVDLQPHPVAFADAPSFSTEDMSEEDIDKLYPPAQFQHVNGRAICKLGYTLEELIEIKRRGLLKDVFKRNTP